jgi:hypothetical protein
MTRHAAARLPGERSQHWRLVPARDQRSKGDLSMKRFALWLTFAVAAVVAVPGCAEPVDDESGGLRPRPRDPAVPGDVEIDIESGTDGEDEEGDQNQDGDEDQDGDAGEESEPDSEPESEPDGEDPEIEVIAAGLSAPRNMIAEGDFLYVPDTAENAPIWPNDDAALWRIAKDGSSAMLLAEGTYVWDVTADDEWLYYSDAGDLSIDGGFVARLRRDGSEHEILADDLGAPLGVAVDGTHLYWASFFDDAAVRMPKAGGAVEIIDDDVDQPRTIAIDANSIYWGSDSFGAVAVVRTRLLGGGPVGEIASGQRGVKALLSDDTHLYWLTDGFAGLNPSRVLRYEKLTGTTTLLVEQDLCAFDMTADATHLYWATSDCSSWGGELVIFRLAKDAAAGDTPEVVVDEREGAALTLAVDDDFIYWVEADFDLFTAKIVRALK